MSLQDFRYECTGAPQYPVPQTYSGLQQRPYPQAAEVTQAQPIVHSRSQTRPAAHQQAHLQQTTFLPPLSASAHLGAKPKLFVPGQSPNHTTSVVAALASAHQDPHATQGKPETQQNPAVSSRLSALKARLDSEKQRVAGEAQRSTG